MTTNGDIMTDAQISELVGRAIHLFQTYGYPGAGDRVALIREEDGWTLCSVGRSERRKNVVVRFIIPELAGSGEARDLELYSYLYTKLKNRMRGLKRVKNSPKDFYKKMSEKGVNARWKR